MSASQHAGLQSPARLFQTIKDIPWRFVAHRGANNEAPGNSLVHRPENTLPAMLEAYRVGAHYVECDIHMTRDNRIVVLHDDTLRRTASYNPSKKLTLEQFKKILDTKIPELRYEDEVSQVSVGAYNSRIPEEFHTTSISPLEEFLEQLQNNTDRRLIIELKAGDVAIIDVLQKLIARCAREFNLKPEQLIFISFDYNLIAESKKVLPQHKHLFLTVAQLTPEDEKLGYYHLIKDKVTLEKYIQMAKDARLDGLDVEYDAASVDAEFIRTIHSADLCCAIWTYEQDDNLDMAKRMLQAGADYINTNQPQYMFEQLQPAKVIDESNASQHHKKI